MGDTSTSDCNVCVSKNADRASLSTLSLSGKLVVDRISATTFESVFLTGDVLARRSCGTAVDVSVLGERVAHPLSWNLR